MSGETRIIFPLLLVCLLTGCRSDDKVVLLSNSSQASEPHGRLVTLST